MEVVDMPTRFQCLRLTDLIHVCARGVDSRVEAYMVLLTRRGVESAMRSGLRTVRNQDTPRFGCWPAVLLLLDWQRQLHI